MNFQSDIFFVRKISMTNGFFVVFFFVFVKPISNSWSLPIACISMWLIASTIYIPIKPIRKCQLDFRLFCILKIFIHLFFGRFQKHYFLTFYRISFWQDFNFVGFFRTLSFYFIGSHWEIVQNIQIRTHAIYIRFISLAFFFHLFELFARMCIVFLVV